MNEQVLDSDFELNRGRARAEPPLWGWRAGELLVDLELHRLQRDGARVPLQDTQLRLLCLLWQRGGRPWSRRELQQALWPRFDWDSSERSLNTAMRKLRRALGDDAREPRLIETLRASGYRWIGALPLPLPEAPSANAAAESDVHAAIVRTAPRRGWLLGAMAGVLAALAGALAWQVSLPPTPAVLVEAAPAGAAGEAAMRPLRDALQGLAAAAAVSNGEPVRVSITLRGDEAISAEIAGRGARQTIALDAGAFGSERVLAEVASRLPPAPGPRREPSLAASAQAAFAEAGSLMTGQQTLASAQRSSALLESVLGVAPEHTGALRMYARVQRWIGMLGRDTVAAREHRAAASDALRRAVRADPRSAGLAADIADQLYWGDWNAPAAGDWYALARRAAPTDADVLRAYAWFALAEGHAEDAIEAMHRALAVAPLNSDLHAVLGWFYFRTGRYDDALRQCRATLQMNPASTSAQICEERALAEQGHADQAWAAVRRHAPAWLDARSRAAFDALEPAQAYRAAMHLAARDTREHDGAGYASACLEAIAGDRAAMNADLAIAVAVADPGLHLASVSPELVRLLGPEQVKRLADVHVPALDEGHAG